MGFPADQKAHQMDACCVESESKKKKWVFAAAGIPLRSPLKPIFTRTSSPVGREKESVDDEEECFSSTPTSEESRIPSRLSCSPPPPRKPKASRRCHYNAGVREFFTPPDLETVFVRRTCSHLIQNMN